MSEYIIKVTRKRPKSWDYKGGEKQIHYYSKGTDEGKQYDYTELVSLANKFTEQEVKKIIKEIELIIYGENSETNGILLKIEILESGTFEHVNMRKFRVITSRFELMDL